MKKKLLLFLIYLIVWSFNTFAQNHTTFYHETFNWADSTSSRGWSLPDGFYLEDPQDNGFNWHCWPDDSLACDMIADPPIQFSSKEDGHLCLFGALYNDYRQLPDCETVQNSIVFAPVDCSEYSSVVLSFETNFLNLGRVGDGPGYWQCLVEVSNNFGVHWATYSADLKQILVM